WFVESRSKTPPPTVPQPRSATRIGFPGNEGRSLSEFTAKRLAGRRRESTGRDPLPKAGERSRLGVLGDQVRCGFRLEDKGSAGLLARVLKGSLEDLGPAPQARHHEPARRVLHLPLPGPHLGRAGVRREQDRKPRQGLHLIKKK